MEKGVLLSAMSITVVGLASAIPAWMTTANASGAEPIPMPSETRLVQFRYDPNRTYEILARPDAATNIVLEPGEKLKALAIGDTIQWVTADTEGHIFIKPVRPGLFTAGTIVTDRRSYQISLRSSPPDGNWYQRVSWAYSDNLLVKSVRDEPKPSSSSAVGQPDIEKHPTTTIPDLSKLSFGYSVRGDKGMVDQVFDDGVRTWIRLSRDADQLPAVFASTDGGNLSVVNYHQEGRYIVVHQRLQQAVLKLADQEVIIDRRED